MKNYLYYLPVLALAFASCSSDDFVSADDDASQRWQDAFDGAADSRQSWMTAVNMQLDIVANSGSTVKAYSIGNEKPVLLGCMDMRGNGVMKLDVPQGIGNSIGLVCDGKDGRKYQRIYLSGDNMQVEDVDFIRNTSSNVWLPQEAAQATRDVPVADPSATPLPQQTANYNSSLNGNSVSACKGYVNFGGWAWESLLAALPEGVLASKNNTEEGLSYEFESDGYQGNGVYGDYTLCSLSLLYGYTGSYNSHIVGYYYHSDGSYDDIVYNDLTEVLTKDYLASPGSTDYRAKVQYQLDGNANVWYDANFDYVDGEGILYNEKGSKVTTSQTIRKNDGRFNSFLAHWNYMDRVSAMRGLTFEMKVPKMLNGKKVKYGFYLRIPNAAMTSEQRNNLVNNLKMPEDKLPTCYMSFSRKEMNNSSGQRQNYRSSYKKYDNFAFVGMDDGSSAGDGDCNDVTFGFMDADGRPAPHVRPESSDPSAEEVLQSWTLGFENLGMDLDFDFNDVVILVTPNPTTHKANVKLLAAGCVFRTELYYGSAKLCEVHEAFGQTAPGENGYYAMVNTEGNSNVQAVDLGDVDWPEGYSLTENGGLFNTKVTAVWEDGSTKEYSAAIGKYIGKNSDVPTAVCISGEWEWPLERTSIFEAYPVIGAWGKNVKDKDYWNWHTQPASGKVHKKK